jgi:hypothetical protein
LEAFFGHVMRLLSEISAEATVWMRRRGVYRAGPPVWVLAV